MHKVESLPLPPKRQELLLQYLREVAKDLMIRGIIRRQRGDDVVAILQQEPSEMLASVFRDLKDAGFSLKQEIVGGLAKMFFGAFFGG